MLLEVKDLQISYGNKITVDKASFSLEKGEILSIVGESGSGKTTVIRALMGCLPGNGHVSGGDILFEGRSVLGNTADDWRKMCGEEMSMIFQDSGNMINPIRKIGKQFIDYIIAHKPNISKADAYKMAVAMLDDVRLPNPDNIMNSYPFELSGGMRKINSAYIVNTNLFFYYTVADLADTFDFYGNFVTLAHGTEAHRRTCQYQITCI